jgi:Ca2+-binding RTX toxin-like protein
MQHLKRVAMFGGFSVALLAAPPIAGADVLPALPTVGSLPSVPTVGSLPTDVTAALPGVTAGDVTVVGPDAATVSALVDPNGGATSVHVEYGANGVLNQRTPAISLGTGGDPVRYVTQLSGLDPDTIYSYRVVADSPAGSVQGQTSTFTTASTSSTPTAAPGGFVTVGGRRVACTITGTSGKDVIQGTARKDVICGLAGADRITGLGGGDVLAGGAGADRLSGGRGNDRLTGGSGNDDLNGNSGNDTIAGGPGNDQVSGGSGRDRVDVRGGGSDLVDCGGGHDTVLLSRNDYTRNCEAVVTTR